MTANRQEKSFKKITHRTADSSRLLTTPIEMNKFFAFLLCLLTALPMASRAEDPAPDVLVKNVTEEVLDIVKKDKDIQSGNTKRAEQLIEAKVLPHFDFTRMTMLAVGRDWRKASSEQKKALTEEFRILLVRTYSNAFTSYKNQTVTIRPLRMAAADTEVTVRSSVAQPGSQPISIDYSLAKTEAGWKVFDVVVEASSLVMVYRTQFGQQVEAGGVDGLITFLRTKNQAADSKAPKK